MCSASSYSSDSSVNNNSSTPRYDASYLSELKASTPRSRPTADNRAESYSVDLPMDDDMMLVDDTTGKGHATLPLVLSVNLSCDIQLRKPQRSNYRPQRRLPPQNRSDNFYERPAVKLGMIMSRCR